MSHSIVVRELFYCDTPVGRLGISAAGEYITGVFFDGMFRFSNVREAQTPVIRRACRQLQEYFSGRRTDFDLPLAVQGTEFQTDVWKALASIPYGQTRTYAQIAERIGRPRAFRAVGMANHCNPIAIVLPCHRVVGAKGALTGYAGGLEAKRYLLELEAGHLPR